MIAGIVGGYAVLDRDGKRLRTYEPSEYGRQAALRDAMSEPGATVARVGPATEKGGT